MCVAFLSGSNIDGVILRVHRSYPNLKNKLGGYGKSLHCDNYGRQFPTYEAAKQFALERGYLQPYFPRSRRLLDTGVPRYRRNLKER